MPYSQLRVLSSRSAEPLRGIRWRKSTSELQLMRESAQTAAASIKSCMQLSQPGISEHCLAARFGAYQATHRNGLQEQHSLMLFEASSLVI